MGDLKTIQNKPDRTSRRVVLEQLEVFPLCYILFWNMSGDYSGMKTIKWALSSKHLQFVIILYTIFYKPLLLYPELIKQLQWKKYYLRNWENHKAVNDFKERFRLISSHCFKKALLVMEMPFRITFLVCFPHLLWTKLICSVGE